jgi:hypothetical protein
MRLISKIFKKLFRKQITFTVLAIIFSLSALAFIIYSSVFLIVELNKSLTIGNDEETKSIRFDIEGYEKLNLGK